MDLFECMPFVVDDDDDFATLLGRAFRKAGVPDGNVRRFRDGEAALSALGTISVRPPTVLTLDLELPGMSGLSVLKQIRTHERLQDLPAFVLSGREDPLQVAEAYALRARGYWVKPQTLRELQEIVQAITDFLRRSGRSPLPRCLPNPWMP
jgi:CheY-like chemotaxis protein